MKRNTKRSAKRTTKKKPTQNNVTAESIYRRGVKELNKFNKPIRLRGESKADRRLIAEVFGGVVNGDDTDGHNVDDLQRENKNGGKSKIRGDRTLKGRKFVKLSEKKVRPHIKRLENESFADFSRRIDNAAKESVLEGHRVVANYRRREKYSAFLSKAKTKKELRVATKASERRSPFQKCLIPFGEVVTGPPTKLPKITEKMRKKLKTTK